MTQSARTHLAAAAVFFFVLAPLALVAGACFWKALWWACFESWLGPLPWPGAFGLGLVMSSVGGSAAAWRKR